MRKRRHPKTTRFFHRFFLGLGMVFRRFFKCFFMSKCRQTLQSNIAKKLRKHWPWRQNQESAFSKFLIFSKYQINLFNNFGEKSSLFGDLDLGRILGPFWEGLGTPKSMIFAFFGQFFEDKIQVIFWKA